MATNTVFEDGDYLSLPVPASTASGAPVRVGGLNAVTQTAEGEGGNAAGFASCMLKGVHELDVTLAAAADAGDPVYITSANALTDTATGNSVFGHLVEDLAATGAARVRVSN